MTCGTIVLDYAWLNGIGGIFEFAAISEAKEFTLEELDTNDFYFLYHPSVSLF